MTIPRRDLLSGIIFAVGAIVLYVYASGFPVRQGQPLATSAGFYPRLLAVLLGGMAVIQIVTAIVAEVRSRAAGGQNVARPIWKDRPALELFALTMALLIAYPFMLRLVGFAVTGFLFLVVLTYALSTGERSGRGLIILLVVTFGIGLLTVVVFQLILQIPFPTGILFRR